MSRDDELRGGDIESLRRKLKDEGRPMKSTIVIKNDRQYHHTVDRRTGHVEVKEII